jgi:hypothetical protein
VPINRGRRLETSGEPRHGLRGAGLARQLCAIGGPRGPGRGRHQHEPEHGWAGVRHARNVTTNVQIDDQGHRDRRGAFRRLLEVHRLEDALQVVERHGAVEHADDGKDDVEGPALLKDRGEQVELADEAGHRRQAGE